MPTLEEVEQASRKQLCRWYRFLSSPKTGEEVKVMNRIVERFNEFGGFTSKLSKEVGWNR